MPRLLEIVLYAIAVWILAVWFFGAIYVLVSYPAALQHVPRRPTGRVLRAMAREMWLVMWTQPLMPIFQYLLGVKLGSGGGDVPVVLVHGYFQNRVDFLYLARRLREAGSGRLFAVNFFWPQSLDRSSATVRRFVDWVREETGAEQVDLLTHSTGGLFVLDMLEREPEVVRQAALIALPGKGVPWRGPLVGRSGSQLRVDSFYRADRDAWCSSVPVLSIYSAHDNVVHPVATSQLEGPAATNLEVEGPGHLSVLFDRRIADEVCAFLLAEEHSPVPDAAGVR